MSRLTSIVSLINWKSRKVQIASGLIIVAVLTLAVMYSRSESKPAEVTTLPRAVETISVAQFARAYASATASASSHEVVLRAEGSGKVIQVARVGSHVGAGQIVAQLDNQSQSAALMQAEGALDSAKLSQQKVSNGTREEEIGLAESDVSKYEVALEQANEALKNTIRDAYADVDAAIRIEVYQFVSNPRTNPQVGIISSDTQAIVDVTAGVTIMESMLVSWSTDLGRLSSATDPGPYATRAQANLAAANKFLQTVSQALDSASPTNVSQATLDAYEADIASARASVRTATAAVTAAVTAQKSTLAALDASKRTLELKKAGAVQTDIQSAAANVKQSQGAYGSALAAYEKTIIRARVAGTVIACSAQVGDIVNVGADICRTVSTGADLGASYALPLSAVKYTPAGAYVFTVNADNTLKAIPVETGLVTADSIIVVGLGGAESIVMDVRGFKEGDTVTVQ